MRALQFCIAIYHQNNYMNENEKIALQIRRNESDRRACKFIRDEGGVILDSVWDLVNSKVDYSDLIPTLINAMHLSFEDDGSTLEGIVRALTLKKAKGIVSSHLIKIFKEMEDSSRKWAVGNALSVTWSKADIDDILDLWKDKKYGSGRQMLAIVLGRSKDPRAFDALTAQLEDEAVAGHAVWGLCLLDDKRAEPYLAPFVKSDKAWIRKHATKAIEKFKKGNRS